MHDETETTETKFSAGAWPLALTVTIGLFVFKHVPNSPLAEISYWLVFAPVLLLVGAGVAATVILALVGRWGVRQAEKSLGRLEGALSGSADRLQDRLETLGDDELQALTEVVDTAYVLRQATGALPTESEVA
jgi:hypothetical protein